MRWYADWLRHQVAKLAVYRNKETGAKHADQQLQFLLAGVTRDVRLGLKAIVDVCAPLKEAVDDAMGHLLVAWYGV